MDAPQKHWDFRAALNFMLGGSGAGLMIWAALLQSTSPWPIAVALALVASGLFAVWLETGRRLRALNVLFNPFTSWMTRESFAALLLFAFGLGSLLDPGLQAGAAIAAAAFLYCQARILRAAKGIPAWRSPRVVPLIVISGLAEGGALLLLVQGNPIGIPVLAAGWWVKFSLITRRSRKQAPALPRLPVRGKRQEETI
jgi:phenylacetyl-CoA:acceptor oxidoreductase subunit 2